MLEIHTSYVLQHFKKRKRRSSKKELLTIKTHIPSKRTFPRNSHEGHLFAYNVSKCFCVDHPQQANPIPFPFLPRACSKLLSSPNSTCLENLPVLFLVPSALLESKKHFQSKPYHNLRKYDTVPFFSKSRQSALLLMSLNPRGCPFFLGRVDNLSDDTWAPRCGWESFFLPGQIGRGREDTKHTSPLFMLWCRVQTLQQQTCCCLLLNSTFRRRRLGSCLSKFLNN